MPRKSMFSFVIAAVTLLMLGGCGGGGGGSHGGGGGRGVLGSYHGSIALDTGSEGDVSFTVEEGGATSGHLIVIATSGGPHPTADVGGIPAGSYTMLGHVDPQSGAIDLDDAASLGIHMSGTAPGTVTISYGDSVYNGTVVRDTDADQPVADVTFSDEVDTNADTSHFPNGALTANFDSDEADVFLSVTDASGRTFGVTVPNSLAVGDTYTFDSLHRFATYAQPGDDFLNDTWAAESGTMTLVSRNGTKVSVILTDVHYSPVSGFGHGAGTFVANGSFHN